MLVGMVVQANSFQPGIIFESKVRSLPKRRVSKRCSTLEGSRITRTLTRLERIAKDKQFVLFGICVHIQNTSITYGIHKIFYRRSCKFSQNVLREKVLKIFVSYCLKFLEVQLQSLSGWITLPCLAYPSNCRLARKKLAW
jgi:hypothetical protein